MCYYNYENIMTYLCRDLNFPTHNEFCELELFYEKYGIVLIGSDTSDYNKKQLRINNSFFIRTY